MDADERGQMYQKSFDSIAYLDTYFQEMFDFEKLLCTHLFKLFDQGKIKGPRCVDIGSGPLIHRLAYASRFCNEVVHTDFTDSNRELANRWLTTNELDHKHRHLTKFAAGLEGYKDEEEGAEVIEARLRSKMRPSLPINILSEEPLGDISKIGGPFDCAISSACIESVCSDYQQFAQAAKNISTLLKPGAAFVLTGFLHGNYYKVGSTTFPCLSWDEDIVKKGLEEAGFRVDFIDVTRSTTDSTSLEDAPSNCTAAFFALSFKN